VCGHYNCGAVKAALQLPCGTPGQVNCWISGIRECRNLHAEELRNVTDSQLQVDLWVAAAALACCP
jgi:carbonic anhydrase